jgi:hypothetical protein
MLVPPSIISEVSTNADATLTPTARDKLDLQVAKQNVNLCRATVAGAATARYRTRVFAQAAQSGAGFVEPAIASQLLLLVCVSGPLHLEGGVAVVATTALCGYRWITVQVRVRVMPSTAWMREATSRPS